MKRLLLPLLAALALPTAVISGDLGPADFDPERLGRGKTEKYLQLAKSDIHPFNCGSRLTEMQPCLVEFKNGRLMVDGSKGIKPSQIKHLQNDSKRVVGFYIYIIYENDKGDLVDAGFGNMGGREGASFYQRLLAWMNTGN